MKRVSRFTAYTSALFLVLALMIAWSGGQAARAATMTWSSTGQVGYSKVCSLAWNGTDTLYAACWNGHVYYKTGSGSWTDTGATGGGSIESLAWNGTDTLYASGGDGHVYSRTGSGSWTDTGATGGTVVYSLTWNGTDTLYAGCLYSGHVFSKTGAGSWTDYGDTGGTSIISLAWNGTDTLYAGSDNGYVYSKTGAGSWTDTGDTGGTSVYSLTWNGTTLYAGCYDGHVYSKTGAGSWTDTGDTGGTYVNSLVWNGTDTVYAGCENGHIYSKTGAGSWTDTGAAGSGGVRSLAWNGTTLYAGCTDGHVYSKTGAGSWTDTGVAGGGNIGSLAWDGTTLYAGCGDGHVYSKTGAGSWTDTGNTGGGYIYSIAWNGMTLYAGCNNTHVYSKTGAGSWIDTGATGGADVHSLAWNGTDTLYAGCFNGDVYSKTGAGSWIDTGATGGSNALSLAWNGTDTLYSACTNGHVYSKTGAGSWTDTGDTGGESVYCLAWNGSTLYAGCQNGHVYSKTGAGSWTDTGNTGTGPVYSLTWNGTDILYAGGNNGHVYSKTGGGIWTDNGYTGDADVWSLAWDGTDTTLYAGCNGGVFSGVSGPATTHTITASYGPNGTISPSGPVSVNDGADQTFNVAPAAHYHIDTLTVDGAPVTPAPTYTFHTVTTDHTIAATFAMTTHTLHASAGANGTISPSGSVTVNDGANKTFNITPNTNYQVANVTVDGANVGAVATYTFYAVTANHTIAASFALVPTTPSITSVSPPSGPPGTTVTINGSNFGTTHAAPAPGSAGAGSGSYVSFNGVHTTSYPKWTDTQIKAVVPQGAKPGPVTVVTSAGTSNADKTFNVCSPTWYLAEGTTDWGFSTYITIENPNSAAVKAKVTYMPSGKANKTETVNLPASSQTTLTNDHLIGVMGGTSDFSTKVECTDATKTIAVDRTMTWTGPGAASPEAHSSVGVTSPAKTWYLPEGSSKWGFECWLLIQNPSTTNAANCTVTYMIEGQGPKTVSHTVPKASRASFNMADDIGSADASIKVVSDIPVIPERAMYRNNRREGHDSIGTTTPAADYYLAEGATGYNVGYITYVLVQNPNDTPTDVTLTYMTQGGQVAGPSFQMPANSRKTVEVNDQLPANTDVSTHVHGSKPIIAERAMYWGAGTPLGEACHDSIGMDQPHTSFYLPDGQSSEGMETWTLVQNPNGSDVQVEISYLTPMGTGNVVKTETIPANSRRTFNMAEHSGLNGRAAIMVTSKTSGKKIMVERAMYWNARGAGTDTIGGYSD